MQVNPQEVSAEKATTPAADLRLVSVEQLQKIHRELDACQKVIWLAGCGQRGYGFDPSYVTGAQEQLKEIETLIHGAAPVAQAWQVPDGWKLVPIEPTKEMMLNGSSCQHHDHDDMSCIQRKMRHGIWSKMIAAAPAQGGE
ncbi:hypothetical protein N7403_09825 [Pseudomonas nitroreducens]|uniref:hypothetical protein n=1 Tax=Pseudomonas nitroreducens TaxID=46680 RepID=UPI00244B2628|nr:hypothetical protein [Pseudomonas nitroreducens]MDG9854148.1 hypothetical protein [Pseudomonas nitroreducens]